MDSDSDCLPPLVGSDSDGPILIGRGRGRGRKRGRGIGRGQGKRRKRSPVSARGLAPGPWNGEELDDWHCTLITDLLGGDEEAALRLRTNLLGKLQFYTDYSGVDAPRLAMEQALLGCEAFFGHSFGGCVCFSRSCDIGRVQTEVLVRASKELHNSEQCHFGCIVSRLPSFAQDWVKSAMPPEDAPKEVKESAMIDIQRYLDSHSELCFGRGLKCKCFVHGKNCPVWPGEECQSAVGPARPAIEGGGEGHAAGVDQLLEGCPGFLEEEGDELLSSAAAPPLRINVAGVTCVAYSAEGKQERGAHKSELPHSIWASERRQWAQDGREDLFFSECVKRYPVQEKLVDKMKGHDIKSVVTGPLQRGIPVRRDRLGMAGTNKKTILWVGPENYKADFKQKFHRALQLDGSVFFRASENDRNAMYASYAQGRKHFLRVRDVAKTDTFELYNMVFPPGTYCF